MLTEKRACYRSKVTSKYNDFHSLHSRNEYPNNKLWVTKGLKEVLNEKKRVFASGSLQDRKEIQRKVNKEIYKANASTGTRCSVP